MNFLYDIKNITIIVLLTCIGLVWSYYSIALKAANNRAEQANQKMMMYADGISTQNAAIEKLQSDVNTKNAKLKSLERKIAAEYLNSQKEGFTLAASEVPKGCEDAFKWQAIQATKMGID